MNNIIYRTADTRWDLRSGFGNHRFIVRAPAGEYVIATIPWRRQDSEPEKIGIRICCGERCDGIGSVEIRELRLLSASRHEGRIVFRAPAAGEYEIYYMPYTMPGEWYAPEVTYRSPKETVPDEIWLRGTESAEAVEAEVIAYESRTEFDSFYPMEIVMTDGERTSFAGERPFSVVAESRTLPVRMKRDLPLLWLSRGERLCLRDTAYSNEHYTFQLALCARDDIKGVKVRFIDGDGRELTPWECACFNLYGVDTSGNEFTIERDAASGEVLPLWCGVRLECFKGDSLTIRAEVSAENIEYTETAEISLAISPEEIVRHGDDDLWRMSRLFWLNDSIGCSNETIAPYTPVKVDEGESTVCILGRSFDVGALGLPRQIVSHYDDFVQISDERTTELLSSPITVTAADENGSLDLSGVTSRWEHPGTLLSRVTCGGRFGDLDIKSDVSYESDGNVDCGIDITALKEGDYSFKLSIPLRRDAVPYMMGMCREGGSTPSRYVIRCNKSIDGNEVWLGSTKAGIQLKLMPETESWRGAASRLWENGGRGELRISRSGDTVLLEADTGAFHFSEGQTERLHFHLIVTPFHPIDYKHHFTHHYYHKNPWNSTEHIPDLDRAKSLDTHTVILHQGSPLNENINYPFILADKLKAEIDRAHGMGLKYKIYYTVRELSNYAPEIWAFRALGDEVLVNKGRRCLADFFAKEKCEEMPDGGAWLAEHLTEGFTPAWHQFLQSGEYDCAVAITKNSRFHNYYLKGLDWLLRVVGIDGVYLDGIGYNRHIMRRVRRIMEAAKPGICDIDIHCGNEHSSYYGNGVSSCIYLEHFAYADSIWNGEGFDCASASADNMLTEMCGIPFGLMGEMLERGGNPWRGMIFGMTSRCGWSQGGVSTTIWRRVWDKLGIADAKMYGYWHPQCPVSVENDQVKATAYVKDNGEVLICLASWFPYTRDFYLSIDYKALGLEGEYELYAPMIEGMIPHDRILPLEGVDLSAPAGNLQEETVFDADSPIPICPGKGWMLFLRRKG